MLILSMMLSVAACTGTDSKSTTTNDVLGTLTGHSPTPPAAFSQANGGTVGVMCQRALSQLAKSYDCIDGSPNPYLDDYLASTYIPGGKEVCLRDEAVVLAIDQCQYASCQLAAGQGIYTDSLDGAGHDFDAALITCKTDVTRTPTCTTFALLPCP